MQAVEICTARSLPTSRRRRPRATTTWPCVAAGCSGSGTRSFDPDETWETPVALQARRRGAGRIKIGHTLRRLSYC